MIISKTRVWQAISAVLAILLVASIYTGGFKGGSSPTGGSVAVDQTALSAIVLNDERCVECDVTNLLAQLRTLFSAMSVKELDYNSNEGKKLYQDSSIKVLPAILFTDKIKEQTNYAQVQNYLVQAGSYLSLRIGAQFDPTAEICDNEIDDTGDGKIDCDDPDCENSMLCREEIKNKLDVFVMSQCPYGTRALDAMKEVLDNFKNNIDFDIHYIATELPDGSFSALHGQPEVDENIRELCAVKYYPDNYKYMDYIWCRNRDIRSTDWQSCAKAAFGTADVIKTCFEGAEGKQLLSKDIEIANQLGIGASPTWLANNQVQFSGIDSETTKQNYCKANPGLAGCSNTLTASSDVPAGGCGV